MLFYYKLQIESHYLQCLFASRLPGEPAPVSAEGGARGLHQVGPSEGPSALGRQLWKPRLTALGQQALTLGLLWQDACSLPRRPPPATLSRSALGSPQTAPPPTEQGSSAHSWVALGQCAELAGPGVCLLL